MIVKCLQIMDKGREAVIEYSSTMEDVRNHLSNMGGNRDCFQIMDRGREDVVQCLSTKDSNKDYFSTMDRDREKVVEYF